MLPVFSTLIQVLCNVNAYLPSMQTECQLHLWTNEVEAKQSTQGGESFQNDAGGMLPRFISKNSRLLKCL